MNVRCPYEIGESIGLEMMLKELFRFIWRGAVGGAVVPTLVYTYVMSIFFGSILFWYLLLISFFNLIPGAIVGFCLWVLCVRFVDRLGSLSRILLGMALVSTIALLRLGYSLPSQLQDSMDQAGLLAQLPRFLFWLLINGALTGGLAGWLCPATAVFRREPKLTYWERVREYEAAQAERDYWLAQLDSKSPRDDKRST